MMGLIRPIYSDLIWFRSQTIGPRVNVHPSIPPLPDHSCHTPACPISLMRSDRSTGPPLEKEINWIPARQNTANGRRTQGATQLPFRTND